LGTKRKKHAVAEVPMSALGQKQTL
jgi:hypothetical protein